MNLFVAIFLHTINMHKRITYSDYTRTELKALVEDKNILFFRIQNLKDKARLNALSRNQYARKISLYLLAERYTN